MFISYPNSCKRALGPSGKGGSPQSVGGSLLAGVESCCFLGYSSLGWELWEGDGGLRKAIGDPNFSEKET